ncbi:MAG: transposase [Minisyncoccota bacterium]
MQRKIDFAPGEYYHLYNRGVEKRKIFLSEIDYKRFTTLLYSANSSTPVHLGNYQGRSLINIPRGEPLVAIGAWCLMPNHFHILVKELADGNISLFMKKLLTGYSMYFNTKYDRSGALFEGNFKAQHLDNDNYLKYQYTYIHLNPIGIIDDGWKEKVLKNKNKAKSFLSAYRYSSFFEYKYPNKDREESHILNQINFPEYFANNIEFEDMVEEWINFEI